MAEPVYPLMLQVGVMPPHYHPFLLLPRRCQICKEQIGVFVLSTNPAFLLPSSSCKIVWRASSQLWSNRSFDV